MKRKYVYLYLLGLLLFSVACTGNFRDYNTDLSGITDDDLIIDDNGYGIRLGIIQQGIYFNYDFGKGKNWPFQLIQNLNAVLSTNPYLSATILDSSIAWVRK